MLKQRNEQIQLITRTIDVFICIGAFVLAFWIRNYTAVGRLGFLSGGNVGTLESNAWLLSLSLVLHFFVYPFVGFYESVRVKPITSIVWMVLKALVIEFFVLSSAVFILQVKTTSRTLFALYIVLNYSLVLVEKLSIRIVLSGIRRRGYNFRQVLIVGLGESAANVIRVLKKNHHWGYLPCGLLDPQKQVVQTAVSVETENKITQVEGVPVIGTTDELEQVLQNRAIDEVFFALDKFDTTTLIDQIQLCEKLGIPARFSLAWFHLPLSKVMFSHVDQLPVLTFYTTLMTPIEASMKRMIDVMVSLVGLLITGILYPWISYRIKKESPGPVIFKQVRVGENGRRFTCYKFRTMHLDAEELKKGLMNDNVMDGPMFKLENDPRVFLFGEFIRRTSLDELPQFFNIFRGDMSVVGTRPPTPDEVSQYAVQYRRRLSIRPGLTGLWQVSGRSQIRKFEDVLAMDLQYIDEWSIWLDVKIIFKTIWVTLFRRGAY